MGLREGEIIVPPGKVLIRQGEISRDVFYWTEGGRVRISVDDKPIKEIEFTAFEKHFFGDLAAVLGRPRSASVESLTPNKFIQISFESGKVERLIQSSPEVTRMWLGSLARIAHDALSSIQARDREAAKTVQDIAQKEAGVAAGQRAWRGALFLARHAADHFGNPVLQGLAKYCEELRLLDEALGEAEAVNLDMVDVQFRRQMQAAVTRAAGPAAAPPMEAPPDAPAVTSAPPPAAAAVPPLPEGAETQEVTLPPNTAVLRQGDKSRDIWYWKDGGSVRIIVDGKPIRDLAYDHEKKSFLGDLAALLGRPRTSTVETVTENTFLRIPFETGKIDAFLKSSPVLAQQWVSSLARAAYDGIDTLKQRQKAVDALKERLRSFDVQERVHRKKWSGALFVAEKAYSKTVNPALGSVYRYLQRLKLFGVEEGKALDMDAKLLNADLQQALF